MNRRKFLQSAGAVSTGLVLPKMGCVRAEAAVPGPWRTFEVTTRVEIPNSTGPTRVWLPAALLGKTPFQTTLSNRFNADGGKAKIVEGRADSLGIIAAEFPAGVKPVLTLISRVATRNYGIDLSASGPAPQANRAELRYCLRAT